MATSRRSENGSGWTRMAGAPYATRRRWFWIKEDAARFERGGDGDCELRRYRDGAGDDDGVRRARTMRLASKWTMRH